MTLEQGTLLNHRYRIVEVLGQGGMGAVYRAVDEHLGVAVAVKENLYLAEEYTRQFRREATILAGLRHLSLPRVGDYFVVPGQGQYLVMDFIEGEDLRQRMERVSLLPEADAILIGAAVCDALTYLHTRQPPIIHRDLKPGNVKITPSGQVILVDFGLAKLMSGDQATTTGARAMTPGYSPPEQYGTARTDPRSDIYSLAATLYAGLTGVIPEDGLARLTRDVDLTPTRRLNPRISRRLAAVIETALSVQPDDRYQSTDDFKSALLSALPSTHLPQGEITVSPPPEQPSSLVPVEIIEPDPPTPPRNYPLAARRRNIINLRTRGWRTGSNVLALMLIVLVLGGGIGLIIRPDPVRIWLASLGPPTPTLTPSASPTQAPTSTPCKNPGCLPDPIPSPVPSETPAPTATSTPVPTPSVTPLGGASGEIAFASSRTGIPQVWVMDPYGDHLEQVTNMPDGACQPAWSPDGQRLVFISPCTGRKEIYERASLYIINRDGSGLTALPASPEGDFDPAWCPDGKRIAFTSIRTGQPRVFVLNLDDNSILRISTSPYGDRYPAWSPSGGQLAFVRYRTAAQIWITSDTGQNEFALTRSGAFNDIMPFWAPDNQTIFFSQSPEPGAAAWLTGMFYEDRGTSKEFRVTLGGKPGPIANGNSSPDGLWIVYESWPTGTNHDIYRMTVNGGNALRLTTDPGLDFDPAWNPAPIPR